MTTRINATARLIAATVGEDAASDLSIFNKALTQMFGAGKRKEYKKNGEISNVEITFKSAAGKATVIQRLGTKRSYYIEVTLKDSSIDWSFDEPKKSPKQILKELATQVKKALKDLTYQLKEYNAQKEADEKSIEEMESVIADEKANIAKTSSKQEIADAKQNISQVQKEIKDLHKSLSGDEKDRLKCQEAVTAFEGYLSALV